MSKPNPHSSVESSTSAAREQLLKACLQCLATLGGSRASVKQIAAMAGVNHGLVHYYFGSKEGLVVASFRKMSLGQQKALARVRSARDLRMLIARFALPNARLILEFALLSREMPQLKAALETELQALARLSADRMAHGDLRDGWLLVSAVAGLAIHAPEMDEIDTNYMAHRIMTWMRPE